MPRIFVTSIDKVDYEKMKARKIGVLWLDKHSKCSKGDLVFIENKVNKEKLKTKVINYVSNHQLKIVVVEIS